MLKKTLKKFSKNCIIVFDDTFEKKRNEYTERENCTLFIKKQFSNNK